MELLTVLPHLGDRPTFHIFRCIACGFIDWIAEATEKPAQ